MKQLKCFKMKLLLFFVTILSPTLGSTVFGETYEYNVSNVTDHNNTVPCVRYNMYDKLDIREILGKWRVLEVYMHLEMPAVKLYKTCPLVTIWEADDFPMTTFGPSTEYQLFHVQHINAKFRQEYRHLRLLWDEAGETAEYSLYFRNNTAGYWQVFGGQNGSMTRNSGYSQFTGTIQVLKAVNDHLVLNFCQEEANGRPAQQYSVLFSREPGVMARWEIDSVHALLQNKKLSVASRRMVCGNSAGQPVYSLLLSVVLIAVSFVIVS